MTNTAGTSNGNKQCERDTIELGDRVATGLLTENASSLYPEDRCLVIVYRGECGNGIRDYF